MYVTKLCVKELCVKGLCVCDKVVCERVVCDKVVCVKGLCDKVVCERNLWQSCVEEFCLPPEPVQCHKRHAYHAKWGSMSPSATPATQSDGRGHQVPHLPRQQPRRQRRQTETQAGHQSQSSAISATPAMQSDGRGHQAPRLPRKVKVDVTKRHACQQTAAATKVPKRATRASPVPQVPRLHTKCTSMSPSATPATQSEGWCHQVPRLPRKVKVDVTKRHACHANSRGDNGAKRRPKRSTRARHAKWRSMSPSATPATQSDGRCHQVPRLPRKCHACHANSGDNGAKRRPKRATRARPCKVRVDVAKRHARHAKWRSMSPSAATPAMQSEGRCHQAPRLAHQQAAATTAPNGDPSVPPEPVQCHKCHACHAKWRSRSPSATPDTQSEGRCHQVPRLPREQPQRQRRQTETQVWQQSQSSAISATPTTQSEGRCHQVPRLPRKVKVDVTKRHACHANSRGDNGAKRRPKRSTRASPVP